MYRLNDIIKGFDGLVGWRQARSRTKQLDESLTASASGLYFQDAHSLLTLDNLRAIMPEDWNEGYPLAVLGETFEEGKKYEYNGKIYLCKEETTDLPVTSAWEEVDPLSDYLAEITRAGETKVIQRFIGEKVTGKESKNLLENKPLFDGSGRLTDLVPNRGRLVGFEIIPLRSQGITMFLNRIGLQMKNALGDVKVYLFHSGIEDPLATQVFHFDNKNGDFVWADFDPSDFAMSGTEGRLFKGELPYLTSRGVGGSYYLVYHQGELPEWMDAINYARDWSAPPCQACNRGDLAVWNEMTKYVKVMPFCCACDDFLINHKLWNPADMVATPGCNYGINFNYTIGCDITDFIVAQRDIFANAVQLQVAYNALKVMMNNPSVRVNREQVNASSLLYDLDGDSTGRPTGMLHELNLAYKALKIDTEGMAKVCLGCHNNGVRYGSM